MPPLFEAFSLQNKKNTAFWYSMIAGKKEFQIPEVEGFIQLTPNQIIAAARPFGLITMDVETFA